ncbi:MAG TPA: cutinase family protein, partial [Mycobacterium sp.]|nr:cutinase family protein [Mycobacterium sp.]
MRITSGVSARTKAFTAAAFAVVLPVVGSAALAPTAAAAECTDVDVVFARGTSEPAGIGRVGQALADSLQPQLGGRTVSFYGVN